MRIWVGVLALAVTAIAISITFFPGAFASDEPDVLRATSGMRDQLLKLALFTYAVALWLVVLRVALKRFRLVVLSVLFLAWVGWVAVVLAPIRNGVLLEVVAPMTFLLLVLGVPSVLAVLLETTFRAEGMAG